MDAIDRNLLRVQAALVRRRLIPHTMDLHSHGKSLVLPHHQSVEVQSEPDSSALWRWFGRLLGRA